MESHRFQCIPKTKKHNFDCRGHPSDPLAAKMQSPSAVDVELLGGVRYGATNAT